jgi:hypothetical protein
VVGGPLRRSANVGGVFSGLKTHFLPPLMCSRGFGLVLGFSFGFGWVFVSWVFFLGLLMSSAPYTHFYLTCPTGFFDIQDYLSKKKCDTRNKVAYACSLFIPPNPPFSIFLQFFFSSNLVFFFFFFTLNRIDWYAIPSSQPRAITSYPIVD